MSVLKKAIRSTVIDLIGIVVAMAAIIGCIVLMAKTSWGFPVVVLSGIGYWRGHVHYKRLKQQDFNPLGQTKQVIRQKDYGGWLGL